MQSAEQHNKVLLGELKNAADQRRVQHLDSHELNRLRLQCAQMATAAEADKVAMQRAIQTVHEESSEALGREADKSRELREEIALLNQERDEAVANAFDEKETLERAAMEWEAQRSALNARIATVDALEEEVRSLEEGRREADASKIKELEAAHESKVKELEERIEGLEARCNEAAREAADGKKAMARAVREANEKLEARHEEELKREREAVEANIGKALKEAEVKVVALEKEAQRLRVAANSAEKEVAREKGTLARALQALKEKVEGECAEKIAAAQGKVDELESTVAAMKVNENKMKASAIKTTGELRVKMEKMEKEHAQTLETEREAMRGMIEASVEQAEQAAQQKKQVEQEIVRMEDRYLKLLDKAKKAN